MSTLLLIQTDSQIHMASDTRMSTMQEGTCFVLSDNQQKICKIDDKLIFLSGNMKLITDILGAYTTKTDRTLESLQGCIKSHYYSGNYNQYTNWDKLLFVIVTYPNIHHITWEDGFKINKLNIPAKGKMNHCSTGIDGVKKVFEDEMENGGTVREVFLRTFEGIADNSCGGKMVYYQIDKDKISKDITKIKDKVKINYIENANVTGGTIKIGNGNNVFKVDNGNGVYLGNDDPTLASFQVLPDGSLRSTKATITGTVTGSKIQSSNIELEANNLLQGISWKFDNGTNLAEIFTDTNSLNIECLDQTINIQAKNINLEGTVNGIKVGSTEEILNSAIEINNYSVCAIKANNTGVWGYYSTGNHAVGIDLSNATHSTNEAIRIKADDYISLEKTGIIKMKYNPNNGYIEFYNGSTRIGYIDTNSSDHAL